MIVIVIVLFCRLIGLPPETEWPVDISVPWNSLQQFPKQHIENVVPKIEPLAKDLLEVSINLFVSH